MESSSARHGAACHGSKPELIHAPSRRSLSERFLGPSCFSWAGWRANGGWTSSTRIQSVEWATPWSRTAENFANYTGDQGYPGGRFFDPLGLAGKSRDGVYEPDREKLERLKLAEIKHSRLAMLAMLIFYFEAGQGKTPLGALGL